MLESGFNSEGYFDNYNLDSNELKQYGEEICTKRLVGKHFEPYEKDGDTGTYRYEFAFIPNFGFLASPEPLLNNCQLKISFDRANWANAITEYDTITKPCTLLEIEDCHAVAEYVSSPRIQNYFETIDTSPIVYNYEECDVLIKSLPKNETEIRFDNLRGGNVPTYIFAGLIPQQNLNGDPKLSSTRFKHYDVEEFNIMLNGNSVNGYPIHVKHGSPTYPFYKFLDVTNRLYNNECGSSLNLHSFGLNFLWSHKFEVETDGYGWVGISMKLEKGFTVPMNLVVWVITDTTLSIDKFHQIEKIN